MDLLDIPPNEDHIIPKILRTLTKEELIIKLQNIIDFVRSKNIDARSKSGKSKIRERPFNFKRYKKRHIALKLLYLGWDYKGFAVQECSNTIESHLFNAFLKTKLIENREASNYHRCGRTDRGVSAFSQVVSLDLRTNVVDGKGVITPDDYVPEDRKVYKEEIDYCTVLNRVLPQEIKVIGWAAVEPDFSARFDCLKRSYKYWFPKGDLDVKRMLKAGRDLIGEHDFRNFCKMDVNNGVLNYKRKIFDVQISPVSEFENGPYKIYELTIIGQAFLWHQIRCIVTVLFRVSQGKEEVKVISQLLDVEKYPQKPQYSLASEIPLVLFDCEYNGLEWVYSNENLKTIVRDLQTLWTHQCVKSTITRRMLEELEQLCEPQSSVVNQAEALLVGVKSRVYKRFLDRPVCDSLEDKIARYNKKLKVDVESNLSQNFLPETCDGI